MRYSDRVLAYVTRERDGRKELLVFDHRDQPDAGTQVPAGRLEPGEDVEAGLRFDAVPSAILGELMPGEAGAAATLDPTPTPAG